MPPSALAVDDVYETADAADSIDDRPTKRLKPSPVSDASYVPRHPLGVRPSGNALTATKNAKTSAGFFQLLPDDLLLGFFDYLAESPKDAVAFGSTCKALHAFSRSEELWRSFFVNSQPPPMDFRWRGTWRSTVLNISSSAEPAIDCSDVYSDALHRPFFCAHVPVNHYAQNIPAKNLISRLPDISPSDFANEWHSRPFILTDVVPKWPLYDRWTLNHLHERYGNVPFRAEAVDWPLNTYLEYMRNSSDESPLYLFDRAFASKMNLHIPTSPSPKADYWPPTAFGADLFTHLGPQRPDHAWLIIGPARSGSTFHKDPNATSAWNAVVSGAKYWIMFPSSPSIPPPPGVFVSEDQSEVTSPLSIAEWLLGFHAEARATPGCVEGVCRAGEVLHVPGGWYHLVLNLEDSVALTQNFIPRRRLGAVLAFLRDQRASVSGFAAGVGDAFELLVERLREKEPEVLEEGLIELERLGRGPRGRWEELTKGGEDEAEEGGFSFGFGAGSDGDDDDEDGNAGDDAEE